MVSLTFVRIGGLFTHFYWYFSLFFFSFLLLLSQICRITVSMSTKNRLLTNNCILWPFESVCFGAPIAFVYDKLSVCVSMGYIEIFYLQTLNHQCTFLLLSHFSGKWKNFFRVPLCLPAQFGTGNAHHRNYLMQLSPMWQRKSLRTFDNFLKVFVAWPHFWAEAPFICNFVITTIENGLPCNIDWI